MIKSILTFLEKHIILFVSIIYFTAVAGFTYLYSDNIVNWAFYIRFVISLSTFMVFCFFLTYRQFLEVIRPTSLLTGLRILILGTLVLTTLTSIPSIVNIFYLSLGEEYRVLRNISSILGGVNQVGTCIFMVLIFTYKIKDK